MQISKSVPFVSGLVPSSSSGPAVAPLLHSFSALSLQDPHVRSQEPPAPARGLRIQIPSRNPQARTILRFNDPARARDASPGPRDASPPARQRTPQPVYPETPSPRSTPSDDWPTVAETGRGGQAPDDSPASPPLIVREGDILSLRGDVMDVD